MPTEPIRLQAEQVPLHATLQHTPSSHWPDVHSVSPAHVTPLAFFDTQLVPSQYCVAVQPLMSRGQSPDEPMQVSATVSQAPDAGRHTKVVG